MQSLYMTEQALSTSISLIELKSVMKVIKVSFMDLPHYPIPSLAIQTRLGPISNINNVSIVKETKKCQMSIYIYMYSVKY